MYCETHCGICTWTFAPIILRTAAAHTTCMSVRPPSSYSRANAAPKAAEDDG